jgi:hypothetical protein
MKVSVTVNGITRRAGRAQADRVGEAARRAAERRLLGGSRPAASEPVEAEPLRVEK